MPLIWGQRKAKYFLRQDWTTQISLIRLAKFDFARNPDGDAATCPRRVKFGIEERQALVRSSLNKRPSGARLRRPARPRHLCGGLTMPVVRGSPEVALRGRQVRV